MSFFWALSHLDSQNAACSRRELLGNFAAIGVALSLPVSKSESAYPLPEFKVGDLVASDWKDDEDLDAPQSATDFGEILGMRWVPERESDLPPNIWVYFVRWTHSTSGSYAGYPCYDGEPTKECDLRLVKQS